MAHVAQENRRTTTPKSKVTAVSTVAFETLDGNKSALQQPLPTSSTARHGMSACSKALMNLTAAACSVVATVESPGEERQKEQRLKNRSCTHNRQIISNNMLLIICLGALVFDTLCYQRMCPWMYGSRKQHKQICNNFLAMMGSWECACSSSRKQKRNKNKHHTHIHTIAHHSENQRDANLLERTREKASGNDKRH